MAGLFDFGKLKDLVKKNHLSEIIIIDTNIFINGPDFKAWKTSAKDPVFLLSDRILGEILRVEERKYNKNKIDSARDAEIAHKWLDELLEIGNLTEGVYVENAGWFITFDCPSKDKLQPAIDELNILSETHGPNDAIFVLLTIHCAKEFEGCNVIFITGDRGLKTVGRWHRAPIYYCRQLPDEDFNSWLKQQMSKPIQKDWDKILEKIIQETEKMSVEVSLTLTSKKFVRNWPCEIPDEEGTGLPCIEPIDVIVAEGYGTINMKVGELAFLWRLPFRPWTSEILSRDDLRGESSPVDWQKSDEDGMIATVGMINESDFDFLGNEKLVPEPVLQGLILKLANCETPWTIQTEGIPSLQSSICLTETFLREKGLTEPLKVKRHLNYDDLLKALSNWLSTHTADEVSAYIDLVTSSWNIGHTIRTRVTLEPELNEN